METSISLITLGDNQHIVKLGDENFLYIHDVFICCYNTSTNELLLNEYKWDYSRTFRKYFKIFLEKYTTIPYSTRAKFVREIRINEKIIV